MSLDGFYLLVYLMWGFFPFTPDTKKCYFHWRKITPLLDCDCIVYCICLMWSMNLSVYLQVCLLYTIMICTDGVTIGTCPCVLLAANSLAYIGWIVIVLWCASILHLCRFCAHMDVFMSSYMQNYITTSVFYLPAVSTLLSSWRGIFYRFQDHYWCPGVLKMLFLMWW